MLCSMSELSVHCTPPPSQPFSDANVADCSAGGGVLHTLTSQLMVPNTPQPYAQGAVHFTSSAFKLETVTNLTLAVTHANGTVLYCALLQLRCAHVQKHQHLSTQLTDYCVHMHGYTCTHTHTCTHMYMCRQPYMCTQVERSRK